MKPLTGDTITDEQICKLRDDLPWADQLISFNNKRMTIADVAKRALCFYGPDQPLARRAARARCADILNTRGSK